MSFLLRVSRLLIAITFIISGFFKLIDPVGTSLIVEEYLSVVGVVTSTPFIPTTLGIFLALFEMVIASLLLVRVRPCFTAIVTFVTMVGFTTLSLLLLIFDPISHCGCFGEAIVLSNWESFLKNVVLLTGATLLYFGRRRVTPLGEGGVGWALILPLLPLFLLLPLYSSLYLPIIDFTPLKPGLSIKRELERGGDKEYKTVLIYSKEGEEYSFDIDNLPDSTYTFVDSRSELIEAGEESFDFAISHWEGGYVTDSLLSIEGPLFILSTPHFEDLKRGRVERLSLFIDSLEQRGVPVVLVSGTEPKAVEGEKRWQRGAALLVEREGNFHLDRKSVYTLNRSYGGATLLWSGTIVDKWSNWRLPTSQLDRLLNSDYDLLVTKSLIDERLYLELSIVLLLAILIVTRSLLKRSKKKKRDENRESEELEEL